MAAHAAQESCGHVVHIALYAVFAKVGIFFGRRYAVERDVLPGIVGSSLQAEGFVKRFPHILVQGFAGDVLDHAPEQDEAQVAVGVAFSREELRAENLVPDRILEVLAQEELAAHRHGELLPGVGAVKIRRGLGHFRGGPLQRFLKKREPFLQTCPVGHDIGDAQVFFIGFPEFGKIVAERFVDIELSFFAEAHHGEGSGSDFSHGGHVIDIVGLHGEAVEVGVVAERFVVDDLPFAGYQDYAARGGPFANGLLGDAGDAGEGVAAEPGFFGDTVAHATARGGFYPGVEAAAGGGRDGELAF